MSIFLAGVLLALLSSGGAALWRGRPVGRLLAAPRETEPGVAGLADLLAAAVSAGSTVPSALVAVGRAAGGAGGRALAGAGAALVRGESWGSAWAGSPGALDPLARALAEAWNSGAAPVPVLRLVAAQARRETRQRAGVAAARLGVRLVLPLGLCLLPAFVLLGIVPLVVSLGGALLGG